MSVCDRDITNKWLSLSAMQLFTLGYIKGYNHNRKCNCALSTGLKLMRAEIQEVENRYMGVLSPFGIWQPNKI